MTIDTFDRLDEARQRARAAKHPSDTFGAYGLDIQKVGEWAVGLVLETAQAMPQDDIRHGSFLGFATAAVIQGLTVGIELGRDEGSDREGRFPGSSPGERRLNRSMLSKLRRRLNLSPRAATAEPPKVELARSCLALRLEANAHRARARELEDKLDEAVRSCLALRLETNALRARARELEGQLDEAVRVGLEALRRETAAHLELERLATRIAVNCGFERIVMEG